MRRDLVTWNSQPWREEKDIRQPRAGWKIEQNIWIERICVCGNKRETRGCGKKLRPTMFRRDVKIFCFPTRNTELWNRLEEEMVYARYINDFKEKLDKSRYRDRTVRAQLFSHMSQLCKYKQGNTKIIE